MAGISTKSVKAGGSGNLPKSIGPGNVEAKITKISLVKPAYATTEKRYFVNLELETRPLGGDFVGFQIDKDNPAKGNYLGQVGVVKSSKFDYKDATVGGRTYSMVEDIIKFMKSIEVQLGIDWLDSMDGKFNTIEEMVESFNANAPIKDTYLHFCIGGDAVMKEDGHYKYYLHLPKWEKGKLLIASEENKEKLLTYDAVIHLKKQGETPVSTFVAEDTTADEAPNWTEMSADDDLLDL